MEPVLVALLFADKVIVEEGNHKKSIIGAFENFYAVSFPATFSSWFIFASATNIEGEQEFSINLANTDKKQVVLAINGKFSAKDRNGVCEFIFPVQQVNFPSPGVYTLTFNIDGHQVGSRILNVVLVNPTTQGGIS